MLSKLNNNELDVKIKSLAQKERELLHEVLLHISEADRRRLYLDLAYPSLFSYLTGACGYSAASAQRRIDAARLIPSAPMILDKIKTGEISLSQASLIQKSIREKDKQGNEKILPEQKQELIRNLCSKSMPESQKIIAQNLDLTILTGPKETHQKDEGVRLAVSFSKEDWEILLKARDLLSHAVGSSDWAKVFSYLGKKVVQKSEAAKPKDNAKTETETTAKTCANVKTTANVNAQARDGVQTKLKMNEVKCTTFNISVSATEGVAQQKSSNHVRKSIPLNLKKKILNRDKCCQFKNKITGRICNSRWNLEIDHLQPIWANGNNNEENLRVLCGNHNRHVYAKQAHIQPL